MIHFLIGAPLAPCTTFLTGGRADRLGFAYSSEELIEAVGEGALVLGRASNVLIGDGGYRGAVVVNRSNKRKLEGNTCVCDSGTLLSSLAREYADWGKTGLEWAYGIHGTVGGAVVGNAGAFGGCMADAVLSVSVLEDGKIKKLGAEECGFGYRKSAVRGTVLSVTLKAQDGDKELVRAACEYNLALRKRTQPSGASAGSVFKAANGVAAAKYIDEAGLKGATVGGAEISELHANFIVNRHGATSGDILQLMNTAAAVVYDKFGVRLEREVKLIGEFF